MIYITDHPFTTDGRGRCIFPIPHGEAFIPCGKMAGLHGRHRARRATIGVFMALAFVLGLVGTAFASSPPHFDGVVFDEAGKLSDPARVEAAAKDLADTTKVGFHVAFLNSLDGVDPSLFADQTATANSLKSTPNVLLIVSFSDRKDSVWSSPSTSIDQDELDTIRKTIVEPQLKAGDFTGAVTGAIDGFKRAQLGSLITQPATPPSAPPVHIDLSWVAPAIGIVVGTIFAGLVVMYLLAEILKRRRAQEAAHAEAKRMADLSKQAHATLLDTDERIRAAKQDAEFAEAQYGADEAKSFRAAIASAEGELQEAFRFGQQIDDDIPESYDDRKVMLQQIVAAAGRANKAIDTEETKVNSLKQLEKDAASNLSQLAKDKPNRDKALATGQAVVDKLSLHGKSALEAVSHNLEVAQSFNDLADKDLAEAQKALDAANTGQAAVHIRAAEASLARSKASLDALTKVGDSLDQAEHDLDSQIKSAAADIAAAEAAVKSSGLTALSGQIDVAKNRLDTARKLATQQDADFLLAYKSAVDAQGAADEVLQDVRSEQEREARAIEAAKQQIRLANTSIDQADSYIVSHSSHVGRRARTRLSEARRQWDTASGDTNLMNAAAAALIAQQLADEAYRSARSDVQSYESSVSTSSYGSSYGGSSGGSYGSSSSSDHHSSSSSGSWGSSSSSSWDSGGGFSSGSFGGGGGGGSSGGGW